MVSELVSVIVVEQEEFRASIARALGRISGEFMRRDSITYSVVFKTQKKKKKKKRKPEWMKEKIGRLW